MQRLQRETNNNQSKYVYIQDSSSWFSWIPTMANFRKNITTKADEFDYHIWTQKIQTNL